MCDYYGRQIIAEGWGEEGQKKLSRTSLAIIGAGGLGSLLSFYLTAAGIGRLLIFDEDVVSEDNLNRQILYTREDVGKPKAKVAEERLKKLNPDIQIEGHQMRIDSSKLEMLEGVNGVVDGLDNMETRMLLNEYCVKNKIPFFHGAVYGWEGRVTTIVPGGPCLACLYGENPAGVRGVFPAIGGVVGVVASIQVQEVLKYFLGFGELLSGRLLIWDGKKSRFMEVTFDKQPDCPVCGGRK